MQYTLALVALAAAVEASPFAMPQAVTAIITPPSPAPSGCKASYSGSFGIAVMNISTAANAKRAVTQLSDGQPQVMTMAPVSMIIDGQIQGGMHTMMVMPVAQISDGQVQNPKMAPVTQIVDGQPQAPRITPAPRVSSVAAVSQISDAQPQAPKSTTPAPKPTASAVSQISDAQPQAPKATSSAPKPTASPVSQITDAQPQAPSKAVTSAPVAPVSKTPSAAPTSRPVTSVTSISSTTAAAPVSSPSGTCPGSNMVACAADGTLALTLNDGILKDAKGRTGYIASNYQFQFDDPPQAGSLFTAGFSTCCNGSLALGGSNVFYQCLSGNFYNLYDRSWAAQCSPVTINVLKLIKCA